MLRNLAHNTTEGVPVRTVVADAFRLFLSVTTKPTVQLDV